MENNIGVIVSDFSDEALERAAHALRHLIRDADTARRCREYAERELSLTGVGAPRYAGVYRRLLRVTEQSVLVENA
jgi:hypothetical protein